MLATRCTGSRCGTTATARTGAACTGPTGPRSATRIPRSHEVVTASDPSTSGPSSGTTTAATSQGGTSTQSSSGGSSALQSDIANGNNLLAIGQYLVDNGYSKAAAAGVASCVDGESGGNPESVGSGGGGLIGWTPLGSAAPNANIITGDASQDMMTQLADILYCNSNEIGQSLVDELNTWAADSGRRVLTLRPGTSFTRCPGA
jgi:Phage tail lysozyme